ncbi:hypothetical protein ACMD2_00391 [Ananas comosus]|uniref:Embryo sac development arrest 6 n=1 Tax=Ananas comosus TaxID=4615 RepID=A0A199URS8_ANACO|nr:hypothetical protein ACMD2_00391 [Ananas comosus]
MLNHVLGVVVAPSSSSKKRKERDLGSGTGAPPVAEQIPAPPQLKAEPDKTGNRLLAGYLAHEFLTRGTILGKAWDPNPRARSRAEPSGERGSAKAPRSYADVAHLLLTDGAHVPGVLNPTQLAQWLQM